MQWKLTVAYDGTSFFGWQKTAAGPSIQETIAQALFQITQENVTPEAASRTDRGVHAEGQVVTFHLSPSKTFLPEKLQLALNSVLPIAIRIQNVEITDDAFHPSLDVVEKEYHYRVCLEPVQYPMDRLYSWHYYYPITIAHMERAASDLVGTHDFSGFSTEIPKNPICTIREIQFVPLQHHRMQIVMKGDRFLYKMARTIAGTLLNIGSGKLPLHAIQEMLQSKDRTKGGITAPPHGLFLHRVFY